MAYHLQARQESRIFSFSRLTIRCLPRNIFSGSKTILMPLETIFNRDENGQIISYIFHVWPQSKQSSEYKAIIGQARR